GLNQFFLRKGIQLLQKDNCSGAVLTFLALTPQLVSDFPRTDQYAASIAHLRVRNHIVKSTAAEIGNWRGCIWVSQHALGREYDQWLAPVPQGLASQQVKILCRAGRLAYLQVVSRRQLKKALNPSAGVLWPLSFIAVGKQ